MGRVQTLAVLAGALALAQWCLSTLITLRMPEQAPTQKLHLEMAPITLIKLVVVIEQKQAQRRAQTEMPMALTAKNPN